MLHINHEISLSNQDYCLQKRQECNIKKTFLTTYKYSFFTVCLVMREGTEIVMIATVLLLVITLVTQGSVFDSAKAVGKSLTNIAAAITYLQNYGKTITGYNLELIITSHSTIGF